MSKDFYADRFVTKRWPYNDQSIRYVRSATGNDANDGLTPATAWATLEKGLQSFAIAGVNKIWTLNIGGVFEESFPLNFGGTMLSGIDFDLDLAATAPDNFIGRNSFQIVASPEAVLTPISITSTAADPTSGLYTVTVSDVLVANAHAGQILIGDGILEYARILSNTTNTIFVMTTSDPGGWATPIGIYQHGAIIRYGDPGNSFEQAAYLLALSDWFISGVSFQSTADSKDSSLNIIANAPIFFQMCDFAGIYLQDGSSTVTFDACDIHDHFFGHDGPGIVFRSSTIRDLGFRFHGNSASGNNDYSAIGITGCTNAFGFGNAESRITMAVANAYVADSADDGILCSFGNNTLSNVLIEDCVGNAISVINPSTICRLNTVTGTGNGEYGVQLQLGCQVEATASTVTGANGDLSVGNVAPVDWTDPPVVDLGQLCRIRNLGS